MKSNPPKRSLQFLRWFCREDYLEEIEGDLTEVFEKQYESSPQKANWKFAWSVIKYFRPEFMKSFKSYQPNAYGIYKSYFKIGWRNLVKNKNYSSISILGLSVSIALGMLILHYSIYELRFDRFFDNTDRIYRITSTTYENNQKVNESAETPHSIALALKEKLPDIIESARLISTQPF